MSYFIFESKIVLNQPFTLDGEEAQHLLNSRRIQIGEAIEIQDQCYHRYLATVEAISKKHLILLPETQLTTPPESPFKINLFQALIKDKNLELILQKTTELGVSAIYLFQSTFSQKLKKDTSKQLQRWNKICLEACKQSGRVKAPPVAYFDSIQKTESFLRASSDQIPILCMSTVKHFNQLSDIQFPESEVNLLIGPEGGWHDDEFSIQNVVPINLGQRILRAETAAIISVSILQFLHGDLQCFSI